MNPILRHEKVAFQCSGGKDSLAVATMLLPWRSRLTVYCLTTPNMFPETLDSLAWVRANYPHFEEIVSEPYAELPSDIVPAEATAFGRMVAGSAQPAIVDRYECCYRTLMLPLAERMVADGITLIIRGQKTSDKLKGPLFSGSIHQGVEYWYPIEGWTDEDVFAYLERKGTPIPAWYKDGLKGGLDCPGCSAWWPEKRMGWLRKHHPLVAQVVQQKLTYIGTQLQPSLKQLEEELDNGN